MGLAKQAKVLSSHEQSVVKEHLQKMRHSKKDLVMFFLSVKAGLRAKEIANLTWEMVCTPAGDLGDMIKLPNSASKGKYSGREIPLNKDLKEALEELRSEDANGIQMSDFVIKSERGKQMAAHSIVCFFRSLYQKCGLTGCSSHSGRRTFITNAARKVSIVGGSLKDVQELAGHSTLGMTQRYIDSNAEAKKKLVNLI